MDTKKVNQTKKQMLNSLIIGGDAVINDEEKQWEWFKLCVEGIKKEYTTYILNETLETMKDLEKFEIDVVAQKFLNKHYEHNFAMQILNFVLYYSDRGLKFVEIVTGEDISYYADNDIKNKK